MKQQVKIPPGLVMFFGILAVSTASIFIRFAQSDTPSIVIAAYRLGLASLILVPTGLRNRAVFRSLERRELMLMGLAGVFLALHFATWITSLKYTSVASSAVLVTTTPLWVAVLAPLMLKERVNKGVVIGLVAALVGGIVVGMSEACSLLAGWLSCRSGDVFGTKAFLGDGLALMGAWFASGYLLVGRKLRSALPLPMYVLVIYGGAAVVLWLLVGVSGERATGYPPITYLWLLALAVVPQLVGHTTFNWAVRRMPAAVASVALLGEPIGATILAFLILREAPTGLEMMGGVLILIGIFIVSLSHEGQNLVSGVPEIE